MPTHVDAALWQALRALAFTPVRWLIFTQVGDAQATVSRAQWPAAQLASETEGGLRIRLGADCTLRTIAAGTGPMICTVEEDASGGDWRCRCRLGRLARWHRMACATPRFHATHRERIEPITMSTQTAEQLAAAITALEAQRALLGDAVVDTALAPLREKLAALRAPEIAAAAQQLKQVSVLFVDVVGSTAMGQQLDPETIHEVMDSALERFTAAVQAEGGRVLQYTGDGMLAAFGTEAAGEDDVEAAIRAGLGIVEEAQAPRAAGAARARRARLQRARRRAHRPRAARRRRRCRRQHPRRHRERRRAHGAKRTAGPAARQPRQLAPCARAVRVRGAGADQRQGRRAADAQLPGRACRAAHATRRAARRGRRGHAHGRPRGRAAAAARQPAARRRRARCARDHRRRRGRPGQEPAAGRVRAAAWTGRPAGCCSAVRTRAARCNPSACCATCCTASCRSPKAKTPPLRATSWWPHWRRCSRPKAKPRCTCWAS